MYYFELTPACMPDNHMAIIAVYDEIAFLGFREGTKFVIKATMQELELWDMDLWTPLAPPSSHNTFKFDQNSEPEEVEGT